jgi:hypothetical protein
MPAGGDVDNRRPDGVRPGRQKLRAPQKLVDGRNALQRQANPAQRGLQGSHNGHSAFQCKAVIEPLTTPWRGSSTASALQNQAKAKESTSIQQPPPSRWEDLDDREGRCPRCQHWWTTHSVPDEDGYGRGMIESSMAERQAMADRDRELQRQAVPSEGAGPQAYRDLRYCGCTFAEENMVAPRQVRIVP